MRRPVAENLVGIAAAIPRNVGHDRARLALKVDGACLKQSPMELQE